MLPCLASSPDWHIVTLPSLRSFTSAGAQGLRSPYLRQNNFNNNRTKLTTPLQQCASIRPSVVAAIATDAFHQEQLNKAVQYDDIEACLYLLTHHGATELLELSVHQLKRLIDACFHRRQPEMAVAILRGMPRSHPKHYSVLMKECLRRRNSEVLEKVLAAREAAGHLPDAYTASARLTALGNSRRAGDVLAALRSAWEVTNCRTVEVCNAAVGACAACGDWASAEAVLEFAISAGIQPDIITYNSLIKAAGGAGLMAKVIQLYKETRAKGLPPSQITYTSLFTAAAKNHYSDAAWIFRVFDEMPVEPNDFILSSFFSAASFATCTRSQLDSIFDHLASARAKYPLNDTVYAALLMLVMRQGIPDRAVDVWRAAQQDGAALTPHLFSSLFAACAAGGSPPLVDVALGAYSDLRGWWAAQDKRRVASWLERDVLVAYNALLHFVGEAGKVDEALAVFEDMKREGPLPDAVTYNTVIAAAGRSGDATAALNLFLEMTDAGAEPTDRTFGALLHAFATVKDAGAAQRVFQSVEGAGVQLNAVLYTSFIDALVKAGDEDSLEQAFNLVVDMRNRGLKPTVVTYGCLLVACEKLGDVPRAFALYEQACAEGIVPSDEMHNILIAVCTRGARVDEALDLVKNMARAHSTLRQTTLNSLIRALCPVSPGRALRMLSLMQTMGMQPTRGTYLTLVTACAQSGDVLEALTLYRSMRLNDMEVDARAGSALISCLCQAQQAKQAVEVYDDMMAAAWRRDMPALAPRSRQNQQHHRQGQGQGQGRGFARASLPKRAQAPNPAALASLAQVHAAAGELRPAWKFYSQLRRQGAGLQEATLTHRRLFEALIEGHCRQKMVGRALIVFDDWKTASSSWFAQHSKPTGVGTGTGGEAIAITPKSFGSKGDDGSAAATALNKRHPKLSSVSLAFLEACCRNEAGLEWRVYDVCSVMRVQKERKVQSQLARPLKASHHVLGNVQAA